MKKTIFILPIILSLFLSILSADTAWTSESSLTAEGSIPRAADLNVFWDLSDAEWVTNYSIWFETETGEVSDTAIVDMEKTYVKGMGKYKLCWDISSFSGCTVSLYSTGPFENADKSKSINWEGTWTVYDSTESMTLGGVEGTPDYTTPKVVYRHRPMTYNHIRCEGKVDLDIETAEYDISLTGREEYTTHLILKITGD